ncbi:MAG: Phospho-N-acetylmuramoyl-pentapeptide-transferas e [Promethearchaeota archaeon CR_4]|nr:MAG: Phospho-N-acetylmuramoyl-pentapeptide-transferas e [Candidatus Lokiarchaeota archaeon CR_4]
MTSLADLGSVETNVIAIIILALVPIVIILVLMPIWMRFARAKGWIGKEIHKVNRPEVPESGGTVFFVGLVTGILLLRLFYPQFANEIWILLLSVIIAGLIGFVDDRKRLSPFVKIFSVLIAGLPFLVTSLSKFISLGTPIVIPILGELRLSIIYPLVTPLIIAVSTNTVNMLEGYNGEGAGTCLIVGVAMLIGGIIQNSAIAVIFIIPFIAAIVGFLKFNKYPARVFPGDIGTLTMGSMIGGVMILGGIEVATFCALLAHIFNSFYVIISIRGLRESHTVKKKDIIVLPDNRIQASTETGAPVTLPRLLLAHGELTEPKLVHHFWKLSIITSCFGVIAAILTTWTKDPASINQELLPLYLVIIGVCLTIFGVLYWKNPRLRGITFIMLLLLLVGLGLLFIIDRIVEPLEFPFDLLLTAIIVIPALAIWYILQNRLFWRTVNRYRANFTPLPPKTT